MTQREIFEDTDTIERYLRSIPEPDASYRSRLRAQLVEAPAASRSWLPSLRWRWTAGASSLAAVAVALALLLVLFGPHQDTPLNPRALLARAVAAGTQPVAYRGTSEITFVATPDGAPARVTRHLGAHHIISTWAVRDKTHWRVDINILAPALQSEKMVAVANGRSVIVYRGSTNKAVRIRLSPAFMGLVVLSQFQGSGGIPMTQTLQQYLQALNNPALRMHAKIIGQRQIMRRTANAIQIWPVGREGRGPCNSEADCARKQKGYGKAIIWIEREHGLVLRYEQHVPAGPSPMHGYVYKVTSLTVGHGPTSAELAYRPPVKPVSSTSVLGGSHGSGSSGGPGSARWTVPRPFISLRHPKSDSGQAYGLVSSNSASDSDVGVTSESALFRLHWVAGTPAASMGGQFVYVQEQRRVNGLPTQLTTGRQRTVGACTLYSGTYPDGLHWLAFARGPVSVLTVADQLPESSLDVWIATRTTACG